MEPHGYGTRSFLEELERPNPLILDTLEYCERIIVDETLMRSFEEKFKGINEEIWVEVC